VKLFAYGSLTSRRRLEELLGRAMEEPEAAVLRGYRVFHSPPLGYLLLLPQEGAVTRGFLWEIRPEEFPVLDRYEGCDEDPPLYFRRSLEVEVNGRLVPAQVYVGNPEAWPLDELQPEE